MNEAMISDSFSNGFGAVYPDRVVFNAKKSWFSGSIVHEYAVRHITSIRVETTRSPIWGVVLLLIGLVALAAGGAGILIGLVLGALGILLIIGSPCVTLNTAGGENVSSVGWKRQEAEEFAGAVRKVLFAG